MGTGHPPSQSTRRSGEHCSSPSDVLDRALAKNKNNFGALLSEKPLFVNRVLLNVAKSCVTELLQ